MPEKKNIIAKILKAGAAKKAAKAQAAAEDKARTRRLDNLDNI